MRAKTIFALFLFLAFDLVPSAAPSLSSKQVIPPPRNFKLFDICWERFGTAIIISLERMNRASERFEAGDMSIETLLDLPIPDPIQDVPNDLLLEHYVAEGGRSVVHDPLIQLLGNSALIQRTNQHWFSITNPNPTFLAAIFHIGNLFGDQGRVGYYLFVDAYNSSGGLPSGWKQAEHFATYDSLLESFKGGSDVVNEADSSRLRIHLSQGSTLKLDSSTTHQIAKMLATSLNKPERLLCMINNLVQTGKWPAERVEVLVYDPVQAHETDVLTSSPNLSRVDPSLFASLKDNDTRLINSEALLSICKTI
jgi:hypothetical protein